MYQYSGDTEQNPCDVINVEKEKEIISGTELEMISGTENCIMAGTDRPHCL